MEEHLFRPSRTKTRKASNRFQKWPQNALSLPRSLFLNEGFAAPFLWRWSLFLHFLNLIYKGDMLSPIDYSRGSLCQSWKCASKDFPLSALILKTLSISHENSLSCPATWWKVTPIATGDRQPTPRRRAPIWLKADHGCTSEPTQDQKHSLAKSPTQTVDPYNHKLN